MSVTTGKVFMIGWEYPPHNSGGLGVACQGLTQALSGANNQIYFTLPYSLDTNPVHMKVLSCYDEKMCAAAGYNQPPFLAYSSTPQASLLGKKLAASELHNLPTSQLEQRVEHYASLVSNQAKNIGYDFDVIHAHVLKRQSPEQVQKIIAEAQQTLSLMGEGLGRLAEEAV